LGDGGSRGCRGLGRVYAEEVVGGVGFFFI
jgi:hypothetical protein